MNSSLDESVAAIVAEVKPKKTRKPKKTEPAVVPEPEQVSLPVVAEPKPEPQPVCEVCGESTSSSFSDAEMDVYRRINAYKRKLLRLKKVTT